MTTRTYDTSTGGAMSLGARIILTLLGAAGLIVGAFFEWIDGIRGIDLDIRAYWTTTFRPTNTFVATVGFTAIVLGLIAIVGLATGSGWLTRLAGALGIVGGVLLAIEIYRSPNAHTVGLGAWLALAGAVVTLIAGFVGPTGTLAPASGNTVVVNGSD